MLSDEELQDMRVLASVGTAYLAGLDDDRAATAYSNILNTAPLNLRDDFQSCCVLFLYRDLLKKAVEENDLGQIFNLTNSIQGIIG